MIKLYGQTREALAADTIPNSIRSQAMNADGRRGRSAARKVMAAEQARGGRGRAFFEPGGNTADTRRRSFDDGSIRGELRARESLVKHLDVHNRNTNGAMS